MHQQALTTLGAAGVGAVTVAVVLTERVAAGVEDWVVAGLGFDGPVRSTPGPESTAVVSGVAEGPASCA